MIILKNILLFINTISFVVVIIMLPFGLYGFFGGPIRAELLLRKLKIPFSYKFIDTVSVIFLFVLFFTYIIIDLIK